MTPLIFAVGDFAYYENWGWSLERSAQRYGLPTHISCTGMWADTDKLRAWHSALRWLMLPELLLSNHGVLAVDIVILIRGPVSIADEYDIGIFLRNNGAPTNMRVLAAAIYVKDTALDFAEEVREGVLQRL